jgi:hypothetical protein
MNRWRHCSESRGDAAKTATLGGIPRLPEKKKVRELKATKPANVSSPFVTRGYFMPSHAMSGLGFPRVGEKPPSD